MAPPPHRDSSSSPTGDAALKSQTPGLDEIGAAPSSTLSTPWEVDHLAEAMAGARETFTEVRERRSSPAGGCPALQADFGALDPARSDCTPE
ncbi:MAG: hypothetical protein R6X22_06315 [Gemmatimonadota bacterium]